MVATLLTRLLILGVYLGVQSEDDNQNRTSCRQIRYNVHTLQQTCCDQKSSQGVTTEELRAHMATILQILDAKTGHYDLPKDCQELKSKKQESGIHKIDIDGSDGLPPMKVKCDMSSTPALTIVEHNYPKKTEVVSAQNHPHGNTYDIEYPGISHAQLVLLVQRKICSQFLRYDCYGSVLSHTDNKMWAYWVDRDGNKMNYWPGGRGYGCACGVTKTCAGGPSQKCECAKNDHVWRFDQGNVTDDLRLPVKKVYFSDTDSANEKGHFTLGPLICQ